MIIKLFANPKWGPGGGGMNDFSDHYGYGVDVLLLLSVTLLLLLFGKCTRRPERRLFVCSLDCLPACLRTIHSTILYSTTLFLLLLVFFSFSSSLSSSSKIGNAATHTNITYSSLSYVGATNSEPSTQIDRWTTVNCHMNIGDDL
uniref:Uncharacterized protein n=1 Tax=Glossina palpalis gambiensis TaxID=67801 RepID=A0A1B0B2F5_9MUSC